MTPSEENTTSRSSRGQRIANLVSWRIAIMAFLGGIGGGVVFPILPALGQRMGLSAFMIGVILAANRIARLGVNPLTGALTDRYGGRGVIATGLFIEGFGTLGYIAALHFALPAAWFLAGRLIWGVGSSLLFVGAIAAVLTLSESRDRGRFVARARSAVSLGVPGGLVLGGIVADLVSADAAFGVAMALSIAAGFAALAGIPPRAPHTRRRMREARPQGTRDWLQLLRQRRLAGIWLYAALISFAVQGLLLATLVLLVEQRNTFIADFGAEGSAGLLMAILMLAYAGTSVAIGRRLDLLGRRTVLIVPTVVILIAGFALLAWAPSLAWVLVALIVTGVGTGAAIIPILTLLGDLVPPERRGRATAIYQVAADAGGTLGPILGLVLGVRFGFLFLYGGLALLFVLSLPLALALVRAERSASGPE
ncbi:MAG TPA: MFS transporter [Gammaproteobacteria bacterium]|nr:MFS transporter [Gammaproteobacteria bacterium]